MSNTVNPFESAPLPSHSAAASIYPDGYYQPITSFDPVRLVKSPFTSPNWFMNLVWMFVCEMLAMVVIGNLLSLGYAMVVAESRTGGRDRNWPDFDINKFSDYLLRGLWPFLWNLIFSFVVMFCVLIPGALTVILAGALADGNDPSVPSIIVAVVGGIVTFGIAITLSVVVLGSMLHSGLSNDFMKGADIAWLGSFVSKMFWQVIYAGIVVMIVSMGISFIGALLLCIGLIAVGPMMRLMVCDVFAQLHDIFVSRGGIPAVNLAARGDSSPVQASIIP